MQNDQEMAQNEMPEDPEVLQEADQESQTETGDGAAPNAEELTLQLEDARAKADDHWDQLVRARAELENLTKRHQRELENAHKFSLERFINELLPVRDSMELGLSAASEEGADVAKLREGTELTLKLFSDVMEKFNVVQIDPQNQPFNPELHQAMTMTPRNDVPPNTVVNVIQKGYTLNDRLVRPAMVMVSQGSGGKLDEQA